MVARDETPASAGRERDDEQFTATSQRIQMWWPSKRKTDDGSIVCGSDPRRPVLGVEVTLNMAACGCVPVELVEAASEPVSLEAVLRRQSCRASAQRKVMVALSVEAVALRHRTRRHAVDRRPRGDHVSRSLILLSGARARPRSHWGVRWHSPSTIGATSETIRRIAEPI